MKPPLSSAHLAEVDGAVAVFLRRRQQQLARADEGAVLAGEADRLAARLVDELDDLLVHLAAEHHLDHVHRLGIGDAHALHELALLAELGEHAFDLRPAAVHDHRVHADQLQQHHVMREAALELIVDHGVAAELDDDRLAVEALDIRQRLGEDARLLRRLRILA